MDNSSNSGWPSNELFSPSNTYLVAQRLTNIVGHPSAPDSIIGDSSVYVNIAGNL